MFALVGKARSIETIEVLHLHYRPKNKSVCYNEKSVYSTPLWFWRRALTITISCIREHF